jgi:hypothetical protein
MTEIARKLFAAISLHAGVNCLSPNNPTANRLIGNLDTMLGRLLLNFTQAHVEAQVMPDCLSNNSRRKTVACDTALWSLHRQGRFIASS